MTEQRRLDRRAGHELWSSLEWSTPAVQERFQNLYEQEIGGDKLVEADVSDAWSLVAHCSWEAMMRREYAVAERELRRFLDHPDLEACEHRYVQSFRVQLALCVLAQGRETEALVGFREVMANNRQDDPRLVACMIRNGLGPDARMWSLTAVLRRRGLASEGLTRFVEELAATIRRCPSQPHRFSRRTSYAKLRRLLWKTLGRPRHPRGRRSPEQIISGARRGAERILREILAERVRMGRTD